jgi:biopolymer transport protein ExbD
MINIRRYQQKNDADGIDISPLIDMVFILLIFFVVTTSFVQETGVEVNKPHASTAQNINNGNILIGVTRNGTIHIANKEIELYDVRAAVAKAVKEHHDVSAVIISDKDSKTGLVIQVLDECKKAGVNNISIAAEN